MLVDAAKHGDVEIPFFCYEPKLGQPVGACRMCLVEIEGIPKLQTSCSTPVRDGMVVNTTSDRVKHAQNAVVEFLLVNHPLDCPVCDKGGECPLQDISYGWGAGPLALHRAQAPLQEAARAVAAGRDRPRALHPLLPLRALLAGGRRGLPARLPRARRPHLRRHPRRPPLRRAVQRQHHRALPGRGAHLDRLPLPRAAVGHRGLGHGLHAVPVAVQRRADRARRRQGRARARARQRGGRRRLALRQGPLRLPGRSRSPERITAPLVRDGGFLREVSWERALSEAAARARALGRAHGRRWSAAPPPTRRASSSSTCCARASARRTSTRARRARCPARTRARWRAPGAVGAGLRHRPRRRDPRARHRARRGGADPRPARAQGGAPQRRPARGRLGRPSTLDPNAAAALRFAPGSAEAALGALAAALGSPRAGALDDLAGPRARRAPASGPARRDAASAADAGRRRARGRRRPARRGRRRGDLGRARRRRRARRQALEALLALADALGVAGKDESGLIEVPAGTNGRGLREVGCVPTLGAGPRGRRRSRHDAAEIEPTRGALLLFEARAARAGARPRADRR